MAKSGNRESLETFRIFSEILGAACGNYALTYMATGGIFIGGGMLIYLAIYRTHINHQLKVETPSQKRMLAPRWAAVILLIIHLIGNIPTLYTPFGLLAQRNERIKTEQLYIEDSGIYSDRITKAYLQNAKLAPDTTVELAGKPVVFHVKLNKVTVTNVPALDDEFAKDVSEFDTLEELKADIRAKALESAGAFAIVLECVPEMAAKAVTEALSVPTVGIGCGRYCSGQIQVLHDLLGLLDFQPKHAGRYAEVGAIAREALKQYCEDVKAGTFPAEQNIFHVLADVARFRKRGRVRYGEGNLERFCKRLRKIGLAALFEDIVLLVRQGVAHEACCHSLGRE